MTAINLLVGWTAILAGLLAGTGIGLFFHGESWLGGYGSWRRRMLRLGHVALVGTGLLNVLFAVSVDALEIDPAPRIAAVLFVVGAAAMPSVCFLSAWRTGFRHLFFIPVVSLLGAAADFLWQGLLR
jgi:hypothetical protein